MQASLDWPMNLGRYSVRRTDTGPCCADGARHVQISQHDGTKLFCVAFLCKDEMHGHGIGTVDGAEHIGVVVEQWIMHGRTHDRA